MNEKMLDIHILFERINGLNDFSEEIKDKVMDISHKSMVSTGKKGAFIRGEKLLPMAYNLLDIADLIEKLIKELERAFNKITDPSDEFYKDTAKIRDQIANSRELAKLLIGTRKFFKQGESLVEFDKKEEIH